MPQRRETPPTPTPQRKREVTSEQYPATIRDFRDLVVPRLALLEARLQIAGHAATTDDRLLTDAPGVRFRLIPRRAAFDEEGPGSVLEVLLNEREGTTAGRLWLDPLSEEPAEEVSIATTELRPSWIDRLLIDFVDRALRRS